MGAISFGSAQPGSSRESATPVITKARAQQIRARLRLVQASEQIPQASAEGQQHQGRPGLDRDVEEVGLARHPSRVLHQGRCPVELMGRTR